MYITGFLEFILHMLCRGIAGELSRRYRETVHHPHQRHVTHRYRVAQHRLRPLNCGVAVREGEDEDGTGFATQPRPLRPQAVTAEGPQGNGQTDTTEESSGSRIGAISDPYR